MEPSGLEERGLRDARLLAEYTASRSEPAFRALVDLHTPIVFGICSRSLGGDTHAAEDATQAVFTILARRAADIRDGRCLAAWLFRTARSVVFQAKRESARRRRREETAAQAQGKESAMTPPESVWQEVRPVLDEGIAGLSAAQQEAVVLRFLKEFSYEEVGASLGCSPDTAKKRVQYGLKKLRGFLLRRGIALSPAALAAGLKTESAVAAPAGLAAACAAGALSGGTGGASAALAARVLAGTSWGNRIIAVGGLGAALALLGVGLFCRFSPDRADADRPPRENALPPPIPAASATMPASPGRTAREPQLRTWSCEDDYLVASVDFEGPDRTPCRCAIQSRDSRVADILLLAKIPNERPDAGPESWIAISHSGRHGGGDPPAFCHFDLNALAVRPDRIGGELRVASPPASPPLLRRWPDMPVDIQVRTDGSLAGTIQGRPVAGWLRDADAMRRVNGIAEGHEGPPRTGPGGARRAQSTPPRLVETLDDATLTWFSEEVLGSARAGGDSYAPLPPSGGSSPILYDGMLYLIAGRPVPGNSGTTVETSHRQAQRKLPDPANELIVAVDAATGQTAWRRLFKARGPAVLNEGHAAIGYAGCAHNGRVFLEGSWGDLYCLEAQTGAMIWEGALPAVKKRVETRRADAMKGIVPRPVQTIRQGCALHLVVADGVLAASDEGTLTGFDAGTGKKLWTRENACAALRWTHGDREWFLVHDPHDPSGIACLAPETGATAWTIPLRVNARASDGRLPIDGDVLIAEAAPRGPDTDAPAGIAAWRLGPEPAKLWETPPDELNPPQRQGGRLADVGFGGIGDGCVYVRSTRRDAPPDADGGGTTWLARVDLKTGKVMARCSLPGSSNASVFFHADGTVFSSVDLAPGRPAIAWLDGRTLRPRGGMGWIPPHAAGGGSDAAAVPCYADGRLFLRGLRRLYCYDLRRPG
jgi:RNA polymerase sigma factor (sigma-70 family)